jgi:hypothetical protein
MGLLIATTACAGGEDGVQLLPARVVAFTQQSVGLAIISPQAEAVVQNPVSVEIVLAGFELGVPSRGGENRGIMMSEQGQHLHLVIDDEPYLAIYDVSRPIELPELTPGVHSVRVVPSLQWHESVHGAGAFEAVQFYVGEQSGDLPIRPGAPLLTYLRPLGTYSGADADSVLLDFHVRNASLNPGQHRVLLTIDGIQEEEITQWLPYYLVGLEPGEHTIRLELKDAAGRVASGPYNATERTITIEP